MPIRFFEQTLAILATTSDTNGAVGAVDVAGPRGSVPPLHVHTRELSAIAARYGVERLGPAPAPT